MGKRILLGTVVGKYFGATGWVSPTEVLAQVFQKRSTKMFIEAQFVTAKKSENKGRTK